MANVFYRQNRADVANDLYNRVTDIWYEYLYKIVKVVITPPEIPEGIGEVVAEITQEEKETLGKVVKKRKFSLNESLVTLSKIFLQSFLSCNILGWYLHVKRSSSFFLNFCKKC